MSMTGGEPRLLTVVDGGERLDRYLSTVIPELTRSQVQKLIVEGGLTVNGKAAKSGAKLRDGDEIRLTMPGPEPLTAAAEDIPLNIIYEDSDVIVVNKPVGLTVHPAPGNREHTLVNALLGYLPESPDSSEPIRPGIVHRLDKDTSGVMVVARHPQAHEHLARQFRDHTIDKYYLVLVRGHLEPEKGVIDAAIGRDRSNRQRMAVSGRGRDAVTRYNVREYLGDYTLLEIKLETGRTHQIRVHLRAIGFPVVGDSTYGVDVSFCERQFVHAWKLGLTLPSGEYREFTAPLAEDLEAALSFLRTNTI